MVRSKSSQWDEKEREDRYGSILIRVFVDTFKSGLAAARRYACHCTRDPSPSSMTSFLAGVNLWRIWRGLFGKREWQRDLLTGMHRSPTVGGRGEGGGGSGNVIGGSRSKRRRWEEWNLHGRARTDFIVLSLTRFDRGQLTREKLIANFTLPCLPRTKQKETRYRRIFHGFRYVHVASKSSL